MIYFFLLLLLNNYYEINGKDRIYLKGKHSFLKYTLNPSIGSSIIIKDYYFNIPTLIFS